VRHSNRVRHAFQARRALGAEGHIRTACPRTACNNCLKMYVKVWHYSLQITIISQLFAWYIQSQHIYSNKTYSSNFWQHISNTKVILQKRTIPNSVPEGHKETLSIYNHPPSVGIIYPIATYIFHSHIFPKLLAAYIQYKGYSSKTYITQLCARRAQRNPFNLQSSPKCWHNISNRNIYIPFTHIPQIVGSLYPIQRLFFKNLHYATLCPKGTKKPFQFTIIPQMLPCFIQSQYMHIHFSGHRTNWWIIYSHYISTFCLHLQPCSQQLQSSLTKCNICLQRHLWLTFIHCDWIPHCKSLIISPSYTYINYISSI